MLKIITRIKYFKTLKSQNYIYKYITDAHKMAALLYYYLYYVQYECTTVIIVHSGEDVYNTGYNFHYTLYVLYTLLRSFVH